MSQTHHGSESDVLHNISKGAVLLVSGLLGATCKISTKSVVITTTKIIGQVILRRMKAKGITLRITRVGKDLGVGVTGGKMRITKLLKHRLISINGRVIRIQKLRNVDHRAGRLFNTGAYPQAHMVKKAWGWHPA